MAREGCMKALLTQGSAWRAAIRAAEGAGLDLRDSVVVGSGSSYYISQVAAWLGRQRGVRLSAAPSCEVMLFPDVYLSDARQLVLVSRSARTTEAVRSAEAAGQRMLERVGITCTPEPSQPLYGVVDRMLLSPEGDDGGVVMLRSFSSMLAMLTTALAPDEVPTLLRLADEVDAFAMRALGFFRDVIGQQVPGRVVFLGGGSLYGVAREAALKMTEMAIEVAEPYHPLEYRHGPVAALDAGDLVVLFAQEATWSEESPLLSELSAFGGRTVGVIPWAAPDKAPWLELPSGVSATVLPMVATVAAQALALALAEAKDIDCDRPRHLRPAVEFGGGTDGAQDR